MEANNASWDKNISSEDLEFFNTHSFEKAEENQIKFFLAVKWDCFPDKSSHSVKIRVIPTTLEVIEPPFRRPYNVTLLLDDKPSVSYTTNNVQKGVQDVLTHWLKTQAPERVKSFVPVILLWAQEWGMTEEQNVRPENKTPYEKALKQLEMEEPEQGSKTEQIVKRIEEEDFNETATFRPFELFFDPVSFFHLYFNVDINNEPLDWNKIMTAFVNNRTFEEDYETEETTTLLNAVKSLDNKQFSKASRDLLALLKNPKSWCYKHDVKFPRNGDDQEDFQEGFDFDKVNWKVVYDYLRETESKTGLWD